MNKYEEAIDIYTKAIKTEKFIRMASLLKRAITYIDVKKYEEAMIDLVWVLVDDPINSEAYYFKGLIEYK